MLTRETQPEFRIFPTDSQRLWHDRGRFPSSLGCASCQNSAVCGGLSVGSPIFDCLDFCCRTPSHCDAVCRNNPQMFALRVREIEGFGFENVPRADELKNPELPDLVPVVFHGHKRSSAFAASVVCLPIHKLIDTRTGRARFESAAVLRNQLKLAADSSVIVTGTSTDPALENWWSLGSGRVNAIRSLVELGVSFATTPNYSLFVDQPRWDDLYSMKRIALVHQEFLSAGIPTALHVNARTEHDWERWAQHLKDRAEITDIAFEFSTGAGWVGRIGWHLEQLAGLRAAVGRPLRLVVRGGVTILPQLVGVFEHVVFLETSTFLKTMQRKAAFVDQATRIRWRHAPTGGDEPLDKLLDQNWRAVSLGHVKLRNAAPAPRKAA